MEQQVQIDGLCKQTDLSPEENGNFGKLVPTTTNDNLILLCFCP